MARLNKKEREYLHLILRDYEVQKGTLFVKRCRSKETFEQTYKRMLKEEKTVLELQRMLIGVKAKDIAHLFKEPYNKTLAHHFLSQIYSVNLSKPIYKSFAKTFNRIYENLSNS